MRRVLERSSPDQRFEFGKNWDRFLSVLNDERIREAEKCLVDMLEYKDLRGKSFLDIGSGSGLLSLAARRLGARVHSFDYDPQSVTCTSYLRNRYYSGEQNWTVEEGSVLDAEYMESLGRFDIVYAWGVLHHTGDMWKAMYNAQIPVDDGGILFVAIYNDQGLQSQFWRGVKRTFCSGLLGKMLIIGVFCPCFFLRGLAVDLIRLQNPIKRYTEPKERGMSRFHDWMDWLGGYPFEVAKPGEILSFYRKQGFTLQRMETTNGHGNNEFLFEKTS